MAMNDAIEWFLDNYHGDRYKPQFYVVPMGEEMGYAVSIEPAQIGVIAIHVCLCDSYESARVICECLNERKKG